MSNSAILVDSSDYIASQLLLLLEAYHSIAVIIRLTLIIVIYRHNNGERGSRGQLGIQTLVRDSRE